MVRGKMIRRMLLAALVGVLAAPAAAQTPAAPVAPAPVAPAPVATPAAYRPLRVSEVVAVRPVTGNPPFGFAWSPHGKRYLYRVAGARDDAPATVRVVDLATGRDRELLAAKTSARGSRSRAIDQIAWAPDDARVAIVDAGALEVVDVGTGARRSVGAGADDPQFSPDGTKLAFVRDGNLFVANLAAGAVRVRRLTTGGSATQLDGDPDWLYSEELDVEHAYAWSPRSDAIAYLRLDDAPVAAYPLQDFRPLVNAVERQRYPLAGGANPKASLHVVTLAGGSRLLYDGAPRDEYLVSFAWTPDGHGVIDEILDRAERHLRYVRFDAEGGAARTVASESDPRFVDVQPAPHVSADGRSMFVLSQRGDVQGLDRVDLRSGAVRRLTGRRPIATIDGIDERRGVAYVTALAPTRRDRALLAVALDGSGLRSVTPEAGAHAVSVPSAGGAAFIDVASRVDRPPVIRRRSLTGDGSVTLFTPPALAGRGVAVTREIAIPATEGPLDAALTLPADFDSAKRYPVVVTVYGGPLPVGDHLADAWPTFPAPLMTTLLAQRGILTLDVEVPAERDDRSSYERTYAGRMGTVAIDGPLAAAKWLAAQPFVDASRLGLFGWSYGGYLTAFTMTHAGLYRSGIAGAPPTDWRMYDTAYTERYLGRPQEHPAAYRASSVIAAAARLSGSLLVIHGSSDDNVHLANSIAFVQACIAAGRPVESFVFPGARHGPTGTAARRYLVSMMLAWWTRTLEP